MLTLQLIKRFHYSGVRSGQLLHVTRYRYVDRSIHHRTTVPGVVMEITGTPSRGVPHP